MTDANKYYLDKREAEQEEYDFKDEYEEIAADNMRLEAHIEELEAKLSFIMLMLLRRIKEHQRLKDMAGSDNSKRREHYRAHALSEALGEVRKIVKGEQDEQ